MDEIESVIQNCFINNAVKAWPNNFYMRKNYKKIKQERAIKSRLLNTRYNHDNS